MLNRKKCIDFTYVNVLILLSIQLFFIHNDKDNLDDDNFEIGYLDDIIVIMMRFIEMTMIIMVFIMITMVATIIRQVRKLMIYREDNDNADADYEDYADYE